MDDRTYVLPGGHFEAFRLSHGEGSIVIHRSPWARGIEQQGSTITWSLEEARQLQHALMALLSGSFDRAVTEEFLVTEANMNKLNAGAGADRRSASPAPRPTLDIL